MHDAIDAGEESVIAPPTDVLSRLDARSSLADQDRATGDELAAVALDPQPLRIAVATVPRTASSFLVVTRLLKVKTVAAYPLIKSCSEASN